MKDSPARGFTLVEVLVAVAVIAILTGLGLASYRRFDSTRKVEAAAVGFGTFLRTTQKKADAGERELACLKLNAYYVIVTGAPTNHASEQPLCDGSLGTGMLYYLLYSSQFKDDFKVGFWTNTRGADIHGAAGGTTEITMAGTGRLYTVTVESGGAITVERVPGT